MLCYDASNKTLTNSVVPDKLAHIIASQHRLPCLQSSGTMT